VETRLSTTDHHQHCRRLAYLTANLDLFGLKLDPNILRTYPLLGFLFSYIGIDRLFAKRFGSQQSGTEG
jgi:hypothetical protein